MSCPHVAGGHPVSIYGFPIEAFGNDSLRSIYSFVLNKHDGNVIFHRIDRTAFLASESFFFGGILKVALALRAAEYVEEFFLKHGLLCLL